MDAGGDACGGRSANVALRLLPFNALTDSSSPNRWTARKRSATVNLDFVLDINKVLVKPSILPKIPRQDPSSSSIVTSKVKVLDPR